MTPEELKEKERLILEGERRRKSWREEVLAELQAIRKLLEQKI